MAGNGCQRDDAGGLRRHCWRKRACDLPLNATFLSTCEDIMGKYFLGWLLGVPALVLVLIYFFFR